VGEGPATAIRASLAGWGVWPACVIALGQLELARIAGRNLPAHLTALTLVGTLTVYGADRWLERRTLPHLETRHRGWRRLDGLCWALIAITVILTLPRVDRATLIWLAGLGLTGGLYLAITTGRFLRPFLIKELVGALCLTIVWTGPTTAYPLLSTAGVLAIGLANFSWSGHQDRDRDAANGLVTLAVRFPGVNRVAARVTALAACLGAFLAGGWGPLPACAAIMVFWPARSRRTVDLCFLPLTVVPILLF